MGDGMVAGRYTTGRATLAGLAAGSGAVGLYLLAGFVLAGWDPGGSVARLTPRTAAWLGLAGLVVVAVFAVPVAAYLRLGVVTPALVLGAILVGWLAIGAAQGLLTLDAGFGLAVYAFWFSPLYLLASLAVGGGEYLLRRRRTAAR